MHERQDRKAGGRARAMALVRGALVAGAVAAGGTRAPAAELELRIDNAPTNGTLVALLFDSPGTFVNLRSPARVVTFPAGGDGPRRIPDLPAGEYVLLVYEDENGNGRLDENFIGIPREPLGFSNRYWPQGPPTFARAAFRLEEGETRPCDVHLRSIFGRFGRLGVGAGAVVQTSPYRDSKSLAVQPIPAVSYIGDRLQILGPRAQYGLVNWGEVKLAGTASYRIGAYDESDSPYLHGLGDREGTLMGGLALQGRLPYGLRLSAGYENDLLNRIGGGNGRVALGKAFQRRLLTVTPHVAANWLTAGLADYEYGVPADRAREGRPAYRAGDAVDVEAGVGLFIELAHAWGVTLNGSVAFLPPALADSPIVDRSEVFNCFAAVFRLF